MGAHKKHLNWAVLMSTHTIISNEEARKIIHQYSPNSGLILSPIPYFEKSQENLCLVFLTRIKTFGTNCSATEESKKLEDLRRVIVLQVNLIITLSLGSMETDRVISEPCYNEVIYNRHIAK